MKSRQLKKFIKQYDELTETQSIRWWQHQQAQVLIPDLYRKGFDEFADRAYAEKAYDKEAERYERENAALEAKIKKLAHKLGQKELDKIYAERRRQAEKEMETAPLKVAEETDIGDIF